MIKNLDKIGLRSIASNYDLFYIDLWGVIHNGIILHKNAIKVLNKLLNMGKKFVLLTNAPRPNKTVRDFLKKMGMKKKLRGHVFTSGEATLNYFKKNNVSESFFHIGPSRDFDLFRNFKKNKCENINDSKYLLCTGLFSDHHKDLNYYKGFLKKHVKKKMICTNPDLLVDRGKVREFCAGSIAAIFKKIGGDVIYFGKPFAEVYNQSADNKNKKILSIGDNLNTDIKGANLLNYDSLIISNGIHKKEIINYGIEKTLKKYQTFANYIQSDLKW